MAISNMLKLLLIGNVKERNNLIKRLHKLGCVEVAATQKIEKMEAADSEQQIDKSKVKLAKLEFCLETVKSYKPTAQKLAKEQKIDYIPVKGKGPFQVRPLISFDDFSNLKDIEVDVFTQINQLKEYTDKIVRLRAESQKQYNIIASLAPYVNMQAPFSKFRDTQTASVLLGEVAKTKIAALSKIESEYGGVYEVYEGTGNNDGVAIVIDKTKRDDIQELLGEVEFSACSLSADKTPQEIKSDAERILQETEKERCLAIEAIMTFENVLDDVKRLHDYFTLEVAKAESEGRTQATSSTYYLEAWLPESEKERVDKDLESSPLSLAYTIREPLESETPPTFVESKGIVAPYESVTNMFSVPFYKEIDPNPSVAFFFFLIFGMMLGDAGYGLLLTLGTGIILALRKPPKGEMNLVKIMFMGGISTFVWGVLFGSYFGLSATDLGIWCWFNPIEDPMPLLILSLAVGVVQMFFGMAINMVALIKKRQPVWGISSAFSWYFLALGIGGIFGAKYVGAWAKTAGIVFAVLGVVLLMLSGTFGKAGAKKVTGALSSLYGIINFFSDLMSYTRIFGLGLATGVIGMVFNEIASVISGMMPLKFLGVIVTIIICIIGHTFNISINALGAYVHNSRLQFVEFFGKFYTGGGELFMPLGSQMRYYRIGEPEAQNSDKRKSAKQSQ